MGMLDQKSSEIINLLLSARKQIYGWQEEALGKSLSENFLGVQSLSKSQGVNLVTDVWGQCGVLLLGSFEFLAFCRGTSV